MVCNTCFKERGSIFIIEKNLVLHQGDSQSNNTGMATLNFNACCNMYRKIINTLKKNDA